MVRGSGCEERGEEEEEGGSVCACKRPAVDQRVREVRRPREEESSTAGLENMAGEGRAR